MEKMWSTVAYCMTCDRRVRVDAVECPGCGAGFMNLYTGEGCED